MTIWNAIEKSYDNFSLVFVLLTWLPIFDFWWKAGLYPEVFYTSKQF